ncbi:hypothetical protein [Sphingomonas asaccharolytica]|uniref:hypothetical protein n=1 Tax=Sphingomonas asaccharolytica TaxID=40681 RepID=UPI000834EF13|nr:hypothetical protein [Sphingomonas asaccharolytica]
MLTPVLLVLLGAASHNANLKLNFTLKPQAPPTRCVGECADRYRLPASSEDTQSLKDRALAYDGRKCDVIGAMRCLSKRRTLLRSDQDPVDTLRASFMPH